MVAFDPEVHGFVRLADFQFPDGVDVYEYRNHPAVDGQHDMLRLNLYLSKDGNFVTIWSGLLEPWLAEAHFDLPNVLKDLSFQDNYYESLFRGRIETDAEAQIILKAIGVGDRQHAVPQILRGAPRDLRCELLE